MSFPLVDKQLGQYELLGGLGSGAMSEVYLARDMRLDRLVAIKVLSEQIVRKAQGIERFEREAQAAARLEHLNVATVFFFGTHAGKPFYAMELIRGWSFRELVESRVSFSLDQVLPLFAQACVGLDAAFKSGVTHRDIKPGNLMIAESGVLKVVDFGLARLAEENNRRKRRGIMGTPFYLAPEVIEGSTGDHRSDLYSLGVTFYEVLVGSPPFDGDTPHEVLRQHVTQDVPNVTSSNPALPGELSELVAQLMSKDPDARPESYEEVHMRLRDLASSGQIMSQRLRWCSSQRLNSFADGVKCSLCSRPYDQRPRPETFHVDLVGWARPTARSHAAEYIAEALGHQPIDIEPLLEPLPFRAAFRANRDRARRMHREFHERGVEVTLVPADDAETRGQLPIRRLPVSPSWPQTGSGSSGEHWPPSPTEKTPRVGSPIATSLAIGLSIVVVVLALSLAESRSDLNELRIQIMDPEASRVVAATPEQPGRAAAEPASSAAGLDDPRLLVVGWEQVTPSDQQRIHTVLTGSVGTITERLPGLVDFTPVRIRLVQQPLWTEERPRIWRDSSWAPDLEFPISGLTQIDDTALQAAASNLVARTMLRQSAGPSIPGWLLVGLAAQLEQGPLVSSDWRKAGAGTMNPGEVSAAPGEASLAEEQLSRGFVSFLVERSGWTGLNDYVLALSRGRSPEDAALRTLGAPVTDLEQEWVGLSAPSGAG